MNFNRGKEVLTLFLIIIAGISIFQCKAFENIGVGVRAIGMGEAFTAIADDTSAPYWNPAGLSFVDKLRITAAQSDLYNLGLMHNFIGITISPLKLGIHYEDFTDIKDELGFSESTIRLSKSFLPMPNVSIGLTANRFQQYFEGGSGNGYGLDVGLIIDSFKLPEIKIGVNVKNLLSSIRYNTGTIESLSPKLEFGASYVGVRQTIGVDINKEKVSLGIEQQLSKQVCVRFGYTEENFSLGLGVNINKWQLDYALTKKDLGIKNIISLTKTF